MGYKPATGGRTAFEIYILQATNLPLCVEYEYVIRGVSYLGTNNIKGIRGLYIKVGLICFHFSGFLQEPILLALCVSTCIWLDFQIAFKHFISGKRYTISLKNYYFTSNIILPFKKSYTFQERSKWILCGIIKRETGRNGETAPRMLPIPLYRVCEQDKKDTHKAATKQRTPHPFPTDALSGFTRDKVTFCLFLNRHSIIFRIRFTR